MDAASDYYDFVVRLGNKVCDEDVSLELSYMAAMHVFHARDRSLQRRLRDKYKDRPEIVVWTFPLIGDSDGTLYRDEVRGILSRVIEADPPDWMLIDLYCYLDSWFTRTPSEISELLRKVESILDRNQNLACFDAYRQYLKAILHELEGDSVNSILARQRSLEIARKDDDTFRVMFHTGLLAQFLRNHNAKDALKYVEEYNRLSMLLGLPWDMELARHYMGLIHRVRGEYDMAIECQFAAADLFHPDTGPSISYSLCGILSALYSDIEDGKQALHWANESFRITRGKGDSVMYYVKSLALTLLGRLEDADNHLSILHKLSLESATELDQVMYLHARGLHELASGLSLDAMNTLEEALSMNEPRNNQIMINRILIALTQTEIQLTDESSTDDSSGPWMVRLESHARKKDYPGIRMHAALLRAEFFAKQGRKEVAQEVLQDALEILDSPSVKTLRMKIKEMLDVLYVA